MQNSKGLEEGDASLDDEARSVASNNSQNVNCDNAARDRQHNADVPMHFAGTCGGTLNNPTRQAEVPRATFDVQQLPQLPNLSWRGQGWHDRNPDSRRDSP